MKLFLSLLWVFLPLFCTAENLFPEWEQEREKEDTAAPAGWRVSYWGSPQRSVFQWKQIENRLALLHKEGEEKGIYALLRTLALPQEQNGKTRIFRFSVTAKGAKPALIQLQLSCSCDGRKRYFNTSADSRQFSVDLPIPAKEKKVTAAVLLYGSAETEFCNLSLETLPANSEVRFDSNLFDRTFEIGENVPGTAILNGVNLPEKGKVQLKLRLPRGIRLANPSWGCNWLDAAPGPGGVSEYLLVSRPYSGKTWSVMLLLESLLAPSMETQKGELELDWGTGKLRRELSFRTIPAVHTPAPRRFSAGILWRTMLEPDEAQERLNAAMLKSGANFILGGCAGFDGLPKGRFRCFTELSTPAPLRNKLCKYAELRNESFWDKRFAPLFRRLVRQTTDVIAAADAGQRNGIFCLCPLCRAEFADFAPKLPRRRVMNLSAGMLQHYYGKELRAFRTARWQALIDAAPLHAGQGRLKPRFWYAFHVQDFTPEIANLKRLRRAAIRMVNPESLLLDEDFPHDLTFYLMALNVRERFPRTELLALLPPAPQESLYSALHTEFLLTGLFFAGFDGFCADLQSGADYRNYAGFAAAIKRILPYEKWHRIKPEQSGVKVICNAETVQLPLLPALGGVFPLPEKHSPLVTAFRRQGNTLLAAVGNFSFETLQCTLKAPGYIPAEKSVTVAPQCWVFVPLLHR